MAYPPPDMPFFYAPEFSLNLCCKTSHIFKSQQPRFYFISIKDLIVQMSYLFLKPFRLKVFALSFDFGYKDGSFIVYRNGDNVHFLLVGFAPFCYIPP